MRPLAEDDEQVAFWRRHVRTGVALCVLLPVVVLVHLALSPSSPNRGAVLTVALATCLAAPLLLLVPVERVVRHPAGRLFFDAWEGAGIALVMLLALLDGGVHSPYLLFFYVLLAHAALAYPPVGVAIAGTTVLLGYLLVGWAAGGATTAGLVVGSATLAVATATCAFASHNHVLAYRRTAAYARHISVLAERDGLTGCLNHRTFHERLLAEASVAGRDHPLALLLVDVDDFKRVNDTYGHPAGDAVLRVIGDSLLEAAGNGAAAGRLGGDEFALLLPATSPAEAGRTAQQLCRDVRDRALEHGVTVSVGVAVTRVRADAAGLLATADRAVYQAKREGRARVAGLESTGMAVPGPLPV